MKKNIYYINKKILLILLIFLFLILPFKCFCQTTNITITWNPSASASLNSGPIGYFVYYDISKDMSSNRKVKIDVGTNTTYTISNINVNYFKNLYICVTAYIPYNTKVESLPSNIIQPLKEGVFSILPKKKSK